MMVDGREEASDAPVSSTEESRTSPVARRPLLDDLIDLTAPKVAELDLPASGTFESQARSLAERHAFLNKLIDEGRGSPGMEAERDQIWVEAMKRFGLWIGEDHEQALAAMGDEESSLHKLAATYFAENPGQLVGLLGFEDYLVRLDETETAKKVAGPYFGEYLGEQGDLGQISKIMASHESMLWDQSMMTALGEHWPLGQKEGLVEKLDDLLEERGYLGGRQAGSTLVALAKRMPDFTGKDWLLDLYRNESVTEDMKNLIKHNSVEVTKMPGFPLPDQLQTLRDFGMYDGMSDHRAQAQLIYYKVNDLLRADDDLLFAFRNGGFSPEETYEKIYQGMPEFHTYPSEVRAHIIRRLAEHSTEGTLALITEGTAEQQAGEKVNASRWSFYQIDPNQLADWQGQVSNPSSEHAGQMAQVWNERTGGNVRRYGSSYYDWIATLPPGLTRDHAVESALNYSKMNDPEQVTDLETLRDSSK